MVIKYLLGIMIAGCGLVQVPTAIAADLSSGGLSASEDDDLQGYLGVYTTRISDALKHQMPNLDQGVLVRGVSPGSPADQAGIERHDIILTVDGKTVSSPRDLREVVESIRGQTKLKVLRRGEEQVIAATIVERKKWDVFSDPMHLRRELRDIPGFDHDEWRGRFPQLRNGHRWDKENRERIKIKQMNDTYEVYVATKGRSGDRREWTFQGTREEVEKYIKENIPSKLAEKTMKRLGSR